MQEQTLEITYENALIYLRPSSIIESFAVKLKDAKEIDDTIKMVEDFYRKNSKHQMCVLNGVLIYSMRAVDGAVPNQNYLRKTLKSFMANSITTPDKIVKHILNRAEFVTSKQLEKQELRNDFYKQKAIEKAKIENEIDQVTGPSMKDFLNEIQQNKLKNRS
jgi:hypothetical protein